MQLIKPALLIILMLDILFWPTIITGNSLKISCSSNPDAVLVAQLVADLQISSADGTPLGIAEISPMDAGHLLCTTDVPVDFAQLPLKLSLHGKTVVARPSWQLLDQHYAYAGNDLGCRLSADGSTAQLKLWAPLASKVEVLLYAATDQHREISRKSLTKGDDGVWSITVSAADLHDTESIYGCFYQYEVTNPGVPAKRVLDPYAPSMAPFTVQADGQPGEGGDIVGKGALVNPATIGVTPRSATIPGYKKREDAIIYEVHIRDFTADPSIQSELTARFGTFNAFREKLSYIKDLGVTHIQLLPVMAWYFGDETRMHQRELHWSTQHNQYNWGYDPQNYFALDGAYSEKPQDPAQRIAEMKLLVDAIHQAGMGVILDVVYTHMAKASYLEDIVPDYWFFRDPQGNLLGDFGNNLATNRRMAEKLVLDSVRFWFQEFKIDGMRWDMMGDATAEVVQKAFDAARAINPQAIFIGEGWRTFKGHLEDPALTGKGADQDWMAHTDSVGVFSDEFRNELKSGFGCEGQPMFLTGGPRNIKRLFAAICGQPSNTPTTSPGDMVQYIEAHDNLTLHDVIAQSIKKDPAVAENEREIHRRIRLGNGMVLLAQGTAFLHAGQEFGRSKQWRAPGKPEQKYHELLDELGKPFAHPYFIHDSYDSSDAVNMFDWSKATDAQKFPEAATTYTFTRGLIALRRSSDAFRHATQAKVTANVALLQVPEINEEDLLLAFRCRASNGVTFHVFVNADAQERTLTVDGALLQSAAVVVADTQAGCTPLTAPQGFNLSRHSLSIAPLTMVVFRHNATTAPE